MPLMFQFVLRVVDLGTQLETFLNFGLPMMAMVWTQGFTMLIRNLQNDDNLPTVYDHSREAGD